MPSASSAKLVKQASTEAPPDPLKQGIIIVEHKIRNLEKRKARLESIRELQASGKDLEPDQLQAVSKYDEVIQTLEFAKDLCKQFNTLSSETVKLAKKQARKEVLERQASELNRVKEILLLQNVLNQIGTDNIRDDFLHGRNGAIQLSEDDLQLFDTFYETVTPKIFEAHPSSIDEQLVAAAEHYMNVAEGKAKEFGGVTYAVLKERMLAVHNCGYFDKPTAESAPEEPVENVEVATESVEKVADEIEEAAEEPEEPVVVVNSTFQTSQGAVPPQPAAPAPGQPADGSSFFTTPNPVPVPPPAAAPVPAPGYSDPASAVPVRTHDVINSVTSGSFNFLQESELDSPDISGPGAAPHQLGAPIQTQTFTNQSFTTSPVNPPPASAVPMYHPPPHPPHQPQPQPQPHIQPVHQLPGEGYHPHPPPPIPMPPSHLRPVTPPNTTMPFQQQLYSPHADRYDQSRTEHMNDNHSAEQTPVEQPPPPATQQAATDEWVDSDWNTQNAGDDWNTQSGNQNEWTPASSNNDGGYQTQRSNRDRGDRGRGKSRGNFNNGYGGRGRGDRSYQNDRQGSGGYYRNNSDGNSNYYQNGYKDRQGGGGGGGYRPRDGMDRPRTNRGGMDRGGPRGGGRGGNMRGRGGFRGQGATAGGPSQSAPKQ